MNNNTWNTIPHGFLQGATIYEPLGGGSRGIQYYGITLSEDDVSAAIFTRYCIEAANMFDGDAIPLRLWREQNMGVILSIMRNMVRERYDEMAMGFYGESPIEQVLNRAVDREKLAAEYPEFYGDLL